jgi:hypothetical protein
VRTGGRWVPAENGSPLWTGHYNQLWQLKASPDGKHLAAIVSPEVGQWAIAVDDKPWGKTWGDMVQEPFFSPDSARVAAIVKDNNRWTIGVDGKAWPVDFDMIWNPVFTPDSQHVLARAEQSGKFMIVRDGTVGSRRFDMLWDPVISDDSQKVLLRYVLEGKYTREVVPIGEV